MLRVVFLNILSQVKKSSVVCLKVENNSWYLHSDDLINLLFLIMKKNLQVICFNIGSGQRFHLSCQNNLWSQKSNSEINNVKAKR